MDDYSRGIYTGYFTSQIINSMEEMKNIILEERRRKRDEAEREKIGAAREVIRDDKLGKYINFRA
jgi:hypothetical protein